MTMTERWPYHGVEFQVYDLTPEEAYRQSLRDYMTSRKGYYQVRDKAVGRHQVKQTIHI